MRFSKKLQTNIIISFALFAFLLTTFYGTLVFLGLSNITEDRVFRKQLEAIVEQYQQGVVTGSPAHTLPGLATFVGIDNIPPPLFELVGDFPVGYHELQFDLGGVESEIQFAIHKVPDSDELVYFIYDVSGIESSVKRQPVIVTTLILSGIVVTLIGLVIGYAISRKIVSPLYRLTRKIESFSDQELPTYLNIPGAPEEINFLGQSLSHANKRINRFIIREKEFTRNASHELRTPLTVIKGAAELLGKRYLTETEQIPRPLERITHSVIEMELTIDTFLILAREDEIPQSEEVDLNLLSNGIIEEIRHTIYADKDIQLIAEASPIVVAPPQVVRIVVSNLLRNAIQHSTGNCIKIRISERSLGVSDNGSGIPVDLADKILQPGTRSLEAGGTGFGLTIVDRICTRLGWKLNIDSSTETGTEIKVLFQP